MNGQKRRQKSPDSKIDKHSTYKAKRNLVTSRLRKAKKDYYNTIFDENKNNAKETWKGIRNLIHVSRKAISDVDKAYKMERKLLTLSK